MNTARAIISGLVFSFFLTILGADALMAQAYVNQATSAQKGSAYIPQAFARTSSHAGKEDRRRQGA